jgi:hypothetical protein
MGTPTCGNQDSVNSIESFVLENQCIDIKGFGESSVVRRQNRVTVHGPIPTHEKDVAIPSLEGFTDHLSDRRAVNDVRNGTDTKIDGDLSGSCQLCLGVGPVRLVRCNDMGEM